MELELCIAMDGGAMEVELCIAMEVELWRWSYGGGWDLD